MLALLAGAAAPGQSASSAGRTVTVRDAALTPETPSLTHRYSVRVDAHLHETSTYSNRRPGSTGTEDAELTWTTRVPALVLRVDLVGNQAVLGTRPPAARGTFTGRLAFKDTRPDSTCFGDVDYAGLAAEVVLQGSPSASSSDMSFSAGLTVAASGAYDASRSAAVAAAGCPSFNDADWLDETMPVDRGVRIHHPPSFSIAAWDTRFSRQGRGTFFPLDKMLAGQSFTVRSGPRGFEPRSCGDGCVEAFEGSVTYVFTALPPRR